jgi:hypothetical protein
MKKYLIPLCILSSVGLAAVLGRGPGAGLDHVEALARTCADALDFDGSKTDAKADLPAGPMFCPAE